MKITVFGGSKTNQLEFEQAERLGRLLGLAGHILLTGGYSGTMEAVSKGANEAGAHVIGVTCDELETWRPTSHNRWVLEEIRTSTLRERLFTLIESCDAAIAMPGGPGTLTEIALTWNLLLTEAIPARPLILVGLGWQECFSRFFQTFDHFIPKTQRVWLSFARDVDQAVEKIDAYQSTTDVK
jgi:uncharacterized protein (TIGR00725 family)